MRLVKWLVGAGGVLLVATGGVHAIGNLQGPPDAAGAAVQQSMAEYRLPFPGANPPSMLDAMQTLSWTMSLSFVAIGAIVLGVVAMKDAPDRLLKRLAWMNALWLLAFSALCFAHRLPPPGIFGAVTALVFIAALLVPAKRA